MYMLTLPIDPRDLPLFESTAVEVSVCATSAIYLRRR